MTKRLIIPMFTAAVCLLFISAGTVSAQSPRGRKAVSAAEVTGTFRSYFGGRYKGSYSEIKILSAGRGKLKVSFDLTYPHTDADGNLTANLGTAEGFAAIDADTAIFSSAEYGQCKITLKFVKPGTIAVTQNEGSDADCGFGFNVTASGTYKKVSGAKPKI